MRRRRPCKSDVTETRMLPVELSLGGRILSLSTYLRKAGKADGIGSEFSDGSLQHGDLRRWISRHLQFVANLILQVGRIADTVDEEI